MAKIVQNKTSTKRLFDIIGAVSALVLLAFPLVLLAILVRFNLGRPVFFRQWRSGLYGKPFQIIKFRTMMDSCGPNGVLLPETQRLTAFGRFMRSTSLDELPELWNVVSGEMSLVGPRPLLVDYLPLYTAEQMRRHDLRPGITGWAQVNGRNSLCWEEKFELDVWYVDHASFWLDTKIILKTALAVTQREGVNPIDREIMPRFNGSRQG